MKDKQEPNEETNLQYEHKEDHSGHSVTHLHHRTVYTLHWLLEKLLKCLRETETINQNTLRQTYYYKHSLLFDPELQPSSLKENSTILH